MRQRAERILIADDDAGVVRVVSEHLQHAGYQVLAACDGETALAQAHAGQPDLALVGQVLPDSTGLEVCRALVSAERAPAVFILATMVDREARLAALAAGAEDIIRMPFDPIDLVQRIGDFLATGHRGDPRHSLTNLAYRSALDAAMHSRLERHESFRLLLIDLNGLRGYNASYGLQCGDDALRRLADILRDAVSLCGAPTDLIGHAGEDDLAIITTAPAVPLADRVISLFGAVVAGFYTADDQARGFSVSVDRQGEAQQHPLLRVSIGIVESDAYAGSHPIELWQAAADVLGYARRLPGSALHVDQRRGRPTNGHVQAPGPRDIREARTHLLARTVDAGMLGLVGDNLRAGLAELGIVADLPPAAGAVLERLQTHVGVVQAHIHAAQGWRGFAPAPVAFATVLDETVRTVRAAASLRDIDVSVGERPAVLLIVDSEKLVAGLRSLLYGMIDVTRDGGAVHLTANAERGRVLLQVTTDRPIGNRMALLTGLRMPSPAADTGPGGSLALGRGLVALLGGAVELGAVDAEMARLMVSLPIGWQSALDSINALQGVLDEGYADARQTLQAFEDDLDDAAIDATDADAPSRLDTLRGHVGALHSGVKRLMITANQLALLADEAAIDGARASEAEARAAADYLTTIEALVAALEARVPSRQGQSRRVAALAVALGRRLRLSQPELTVLYRAGLLADLGLATVDGELLNRAGDLTAAERLTVQQHPTTGAALLRGIGALAESLPAIAAHHEWFDGRGYPAGLGGVGIPIAARIVAVADVVVAMLSPRPYRPAHPLRMVDDALLAGAGSQFDPMVVDAARALIVEGSLARLAGATLAGVAR